MGPFVSANQFAAFIEVVLPFAMYGFLRYRREAFLYSSMTGVMYAAVVASASRAGLLLTSGEIITVVLLLWLNGKTSGRAIGWSLFRMLILLRVFTMAVGWGITYFLKSPPPAGGGALWKGCSAVVVGLTCIRRNSWCTYRRKGRKRNRPNVSSARLHGISVSYGIG